MNTIIAWGAKAAPYLIAVPMAIFGVQHFIYLQFVADFIPAWIPWHTFWAFLTGVALLAAAAGIVFRIWDRWAATLLGTMILLWVVLLHTSRLGGNPNDFGEWRGFFQALAMSGCAFVLASSLANENQIGIPAITEWGQGAIALARFGDRLGPYLMATSMVALGLQHFVFSNPISPQVPLWIPNSSGANYLTGIALVAVGIGMVVAGLRRWASALLGIAILFSLVVIHLPVVLNSSRFESDWTKTLVISGGALLLAHRSRHQPASELAELPELEGTKVL